MNRLPKYSSQFFSGHLVPDNALHIFKRRHYKVIKNIYVSGDQPKDIVLAYYYKPGSRNNWNLYIAKFPSKWYPMEAIIELLINRIFLEISEIEIAEAKVCKINGA